MQTFLFRDLRHHYVHIFEHLFEPLPIIVASLRSTIQPFEAEIPHMPVKAQERIEIPSYAIVIIIASEFDI